LETGVALNYSPEDRDKALSLWAALDLAQAVIDTQAVIAWLRESASCTGKIASMGFCLGGKIAVLAGNAFDANVAFYPVQLQDHEPEIDILQSPTQVHLGTEDTHVPPHVVAMLSAKIGSRQGSEVLVYEGAGHAFYNSYRAIGYAPDASKRAHDTTAKFLSETIG
jgi:carboxymethylenebutenolidase